MSNFPPTMEVLLTSRCVTFQILLWEMVALNVEEVSVNHFLLGFFYSLSNGGTKIQMLQLWLGRKT